jgi:hypothetical protein
MPVLTYSFCMLIFMRQSFFTYRHLSLRRTLVLLNITRHGEDNSKALCRGIVSQNKFGTSCGHPMMKRSD